MSSRPSRARYWPVAHTNSIGPLVKKMKSHVDPFWGAVPIWGQTAQTLSSVSPIGTAVLKELRLASLFWRSKRGPGVLLFSTGGERLGCVFFMFTDIG